MGCGTSGPITSSFKLAELYPGMLNKQSFEVKNSLIRTLVKKQHQLFEDLWAKHNVRAHEGVWYNSSITTILHVAVSLDSPHTVSFIVNKVLNEEEDPWEILNV